MNLKLLLLLTLSVGAFTGNVAASNINQIVEDAKKEWISDVAIPVERLLKINGEDYLVFSINRETTGKEYLIAPSNNSYFFANKKDKYIPLNAGFEESGRVLTAMEYQLFLNDVKNADLSLLGKPFKLDRDYIREQSSLASLHRKSDAANASHQLVPHSFKGSANKDFQDFFKLYGLPSEEVFKIKSFTFTPDVFKLVEELTSTAKSDFKDIGKKYKVYEYSNIGPLEINEFYFIEDVVNSSLGDKINPSNKVITFKKDDFNKLKESHLSNLYLFFIPGYAENMAAVIRNNNQQDFKLSVDFVATNYKWDLLYKSSNFKNFFNKNKKDFYGAVERANGFKTNLVLRDGESITPEYLIKMDKISDGIFLKKASSLKWNNSIISSSQEDSNLDDYYLFFEGLFANYSSSLPTFKVDSKKAKVIHKDDLHLLFNHYLFKSLKYYLPTIDTPEISAKRFGVSYDRDIDREIVEFGENIEFPFSFVRDFDGGRVLKSVETVGLNEKETTLEQLREKDFVVYVPSVNGNINEYHFVNISSKQLLLDDKDVFDKNGKPIDLGKGKAKIYLHQLIISEVGPKPKGIIY